MTHLQQSEKLPLKVQLYDKRIEALEKVWNDTAIGNDYS